MAGTLTISTLSDGTNSTSSTNCIQGSAKAWVNFNGVPTTAIRASYNVSSVTRVESCCYTVTFTNALADANYSICGSPGSSGNGAPQYYFTINRTKNAGTIVAPTSSAFTCTAENGANTDPLYVNISVFR